MLLIGANKTNILLAATKHYSNETRNCIINVFRFTFGTLQIPKNFLKEKLSQNYKRLGRILTGNKSTGNKILYVFI